MKAEYTQSQYELFYKQELHKPLCFFHCVGHSVEVASIHQGGAPVQGQNLPARVELGEVSVCSGEPENASVEHPRWVGQTGCADTQNKSSVQPKCLPLPQDATLQTQGTALVT